VAVGDNFVPNAAQSALAAMILFAANIPRNAMIAINLCAMIVWSTARIAAKKYAKTVKKADHAILATERYAKSATSVVMAAMLIYVVNALRPA